MASVDTEQPENHEATVSGSRLGAQHRNKKTLSFSRIGMTGGAGFLGQLVLNRLLQMREVSEIHIFDIKPPDVINSNKLFFHRLDLTKDSADTELAQVLSDRGITMFIHGALFIDPGKFNTRRREVESIGTFHVLNAVAEAKVSRFFVFSSTFVYGAFPSNPNFLQESVPLSVRGGPDFVRTRVDVEKQILDFKKSYESTQVMVLRFAPIFGPNVSGTLARYFSSGVTPKVMGYDPLLQFVHEDDAARAVMLALQSTLSGVFNIVGRGVLPLSTGIHMCGRLPVPVPSSCVGGVFQLGYALRVWDLSSEMVSFFQYLCVADSQKASQELGFTAEYSSRQALKSMIEASRLRRIGFSTPSSSLGEEKPRNEQPGFERVY